MNRSFGALLCGTIVWTFGSGCVVANKTQSPDGVQIPAIGSEYTLIYKPHPQ